MGASISRSHSRRKGVDSYSEAAPEWIYIYDPGKYKERPRAIYNKGRPELFVEPD